MTGLSVVNISSIPDPKAHGLLTQSSGVPQVITSIIGNPNGSGQSMGTPLYVGFSDMPLVSISNAECKPLANANFAPVHHGIPCPPAQAKLQPRRVRRVSRNASLRGSGPTGPFESSDAGRRKIYEQQSCRCWNGHPFASACKSCGNRPSGQPKLIEIKQHTLVPSRLVGCRENGRTHRSVL
jgi:hypothetical protein